MKYSVRLAGSPGKIPDMQIYQSADTLCVELKNLKYGKSNGKSLETIKIMKKKIVSLAL